MAASIPECSATATAAILEPTHSLPTLYQPAATAVKHSVCAKRSIDALDSAASPTAMPTRRYNDDVTAESPTTNTTISHQWSRTLRPSRRTIIPVAHVQLTNVSTTAPTELQTAADDDTDIL